MNENLNLVELLKDCPIRTKFYSSYLGKDVFFIGIHNNEIDCEYPPQIGSSFNCNILFRKEGSLYKGGECMIFPSKEQRDWSKWHRPFVDGDILVYMFWSKPTIYVYREGGTHNTSYYVAYSIENNRLYTDAEGALASNRSDLRFATEEEKQKLFYEINKSGYKWNAETKTLEKLIVPKFKDGDIVATNDGKYIAIIENNGGKYYVCCHPNVNYFNIDGSGWFDRLATEEEKATLFQAIKDNGYKWNAETKTLEKIKKEKFDPKTLKPFESKVLVSTFSSWKPAIFGAYIKEFASPIVVVGGNTYTKCIPYEGNEHLIGTCNQPSEFYRYWVE